MSDTPDYRAAIRERLLNDIDHALHAGNLDTVADAVMAVIEPLIAHVDSDECDVYGAEAALRAAAGLPATGGDEVQATAQQPCRAVESGEASDRSDRTHLVRQTPPATKKSADAPGTDSASSPPVRWRCEKCRQEWDHQPKPRHLVMDSMNTINSCPRPRHPNLTTTGDTDTMTSTIDTLTNTLKTRFGGRLLQGKHTKDGEACALELVSVCRGVEWTDQPTMVNMPDVRPINDGRWSSDAARTDAMMPLLVALWDWPDWARARRTTWAKSVVLRTIRDILPIALRAICLDEHAVACESADTLADARTAAHSAADASYAAARAAYAADAAAAAYAAYAAADAAAYAADAADAAAAAYAAARSAAGDNVLTLACRIWTDEALATQETPTL